MAEETDEEELNETQRQLFLELNAGALQGGILNNPLWKQKEKEVGTSKITHISEVSDSHENEKYLLDQNRILQDEVAMLTLELDTLKIKDQEKKHHIGVLEEKNDELQMELELNKEVLTKIIFQYRGQVKVLTAENAVLNSQLENAKQNTDRVEREKAACSFHVISGVHSQEQTSNLALKHSFQAERDEWLRLQDKLNRDLSNLKEVNGVLFQELCKAESRASMLENDFLRENESIQERLAQIQNENILLQQQLEDMQKKTIKEKALSDAQVHFIDVCSKVCADAEEQILMVEERNKVLISECNHLRVNMKVRRPKERLA
ncbi:ankyrin repeat domain-containing protein 26-like [Notamacropus eugenii]|uniref:ankyrin repeat domain-containing protein 26-like n=1 Tax=Notamacropus eugenii TaxID=9315 RepID=UPI003B678E50